MALVEYGLLMRVRFRDQALGVVAVPEELVGLKAPKVFGFGNEPVADRAGRCTPFRHTRISSTALVRENEKMSHGAEIAHGSIFRQT